MNKLNQRIAEVKKDIYNLRELSTKIKNLYNEFARSKREGLVDFDIIENMNEQIRLLQTELDALELGKQAVEEETKELKQMYKLRNDDAKDYSKRITELENERRELLEKIKQFIQNRYKEINNCLQYKSKKGCIKCDTISAEMALLETKLVLQLEKLNSEKKE